MRKISFVLFIITSVLAAQGCSDDDQALEPQGTPGAADIAVNPNPRNVLSTIVTFDATDADMARVVYSKAGGPEQATPYYPVAGGAGRILTLGLEAATEYTHIVEVKESGGDPVASEPIMFTTGALPDYLANRLDLNVTTAPATTIPGYIMTNVRESVEDRYSIVYDLTGRIVWYRHTEILGSFFEQAENGNFLVFLGTSPGYQPSYGYYSEIGLDGEEIRTYQASAPLYTDGHDLLLTGGNPPTYHLMSYDIRTLDLTDFGGVSDARVAGHQILRFSPGGQAEFMWNAWDHFGLENWIVGRPPRDCLECDYDHPNSLALDVDGNYLISIRNFSEVTKIDSQTGAVIWRLGGVGNEFTFVNDTNGDDPLGRFSAQHHARPLDNGNLLIYDNGTQHSPRETRAVEYAIDEVNKTATQVWEFRHVPPVYTGILGSAQRLSDGSTLVGFGNVGIVTLVSPAGDVVWEAQPMSDGNPAIRLYRNIMITSLYEYVKPRPFEEDLREFDQHQDP